MELSKRAIIIDTDIGTDVDDALAISYAIKSNLNVQLISTVHGDTLKRSQIAYKLTKMLNYNGLIAKGEEKPMVLNEIFWKGFEGDGFLDGTEPTDFLDAVDTIAKVIYQNKYNVDLVSIAPLTNIAKAFIKYPDLSQYVNTLYLMGNAIVCDNNWHLNYRAHNFKVDPHAVDVVFNSDVKKVIVTTEVCKEHSLTRSDFSEFKKSNEPFLSYLSKAANQWLEESIYDVSYLYDPLVIHHLLDFDCTPKKIYGDVSITIKRSGDKMNNIGKHLIEVLKNEK